MIVFYVIEDAQMEIDFNDGIELAATYTLKLVDLHIHFSTIYISFIAPNKGSEIFIHQVYSSFFFKTFF